jgi:hypothetical protein
MIASHLLLFAFLIGVLAFMAVWNPSRSGFHGPRTSRNRLRQAAEDTQAHGTGWIDSPHCGGLVCGCDLGDGLRPRTCSRRDPRDCRARLWGHSVAIT